MRWTQARREDREFRARLAEDPRALLFRQGGIGLVVEGANDLRPSLRSRTQPSKVTQAPARGVAQRLPQRGGIDRLRRSA